MRDGRKLAQGDRRSSNLRLAVLLVALVVAACGAANVTPSPVLSPTPSAGGTPGFSAEPIPTPSPTIAPMRWSDCGKGFECGTIDVPRDYANPSGPIVRLALIRMAAEDRSHKIGSLLINPGGPGGSGIEFVRKAVTGKAFSEALRSQFDIVGFDPRGVGASTPIRCTDNLLDYLPDDQTPDSAAELKTVVDDAKAFAASCKRRNPDLLPYLDTLSVAKDLDRIRAALGDDKLTYMGFSYGTLIGAMYASLFPTHVRAMILDGAVDPALGLAKFREDQAVAFDAALGHFFADCAARIACAFHSNGQPGTAFDKLMAAIDRKSLPTPGLANREQVDSTLAWAAVRGTLYSKAEWPVLALALQTAAEGDGSLMLLLTDPFLGRQEDGSYSNEIDAFFAVTCLDWPASRNVDDYATLAAKLAKVAPRFGRLSAYGDIDCAFWPAPPVRTPAPISAPGAPPIVVIGTTGDPATPYKWAVALTKQLGTATLVTYEGEGHTAFGQSSCVDKAVEAYLLKLTVPKTGLRCH